MKILFDRPTVLTLDKDERVLDDAYVGVSDGRILFVSDEKPDEFTPDRIIPGHNRLLMPGLVNLHHHLPMSVLRNYADGHDLQDWLFNYIFPVEERLDARCVEYAALLGIAECLSMGTTSVTDMYYFIDSIAAAVYSSGIKANLSRGVQGGDGFEKGYNELVESIVNHHKPGGLLRVDAGLHGEYTSSPPVWEAVAGISKKFGVPVHVHVSETAREHDECVKKYGKTPTRLFSDAGLLNNAICAHCVHVTDGDMELLNAARATVAHNPASNLKLASGFARVAQMRGMGINVGIGTDGVSSNNAADMFEAMKLTSIIQKALTGNPMAISAAEALRMATQYGAIAQGRGDECGMIAEGYDADMILLDLDKPHMRPLHDLHSLAVYSAKPGDVVLTMVRGRVLYENGVFTTIDIEKVKAEIDGYVSKKLFI